MQSQRLFGLAERIKVEEERAMIQAAQERADNQWFEEAQLGGGVSV